MRSIADIVCPSASYCSFWYEEVDFETDQQRNFLRQIVDWLPGTLECFRGLFWDIDVQVPNMITHPPGSTGSELERLLRKFSTKFAVLKDFRPTLPKPLDDSISNNVRLLVRCHMNGNLTNVSSDVSLVCPNPFPNVFFTQPQTLFRVLFRGRDTLTLLK